jgi:hypothetical protein
MYTDGGLRISTDCHHKQARSGALLKERMTYWYLHRPEIFVKPLYKLVYIIDH